MTPTEHALRPSLMEETLRRNLASGIELSEQVRFFMTATFGDASPASLQSLLAEESGAERDSLLDLLYFPERSLQEAIEPLLEAQPMAEADVARLARRFKADPPNTIFLFPGTRIRTVYAMPRFVADAFLNRLNLVWRPAATLAAVLARTDARPLSPSGDPSQGRYRLRVWLRDAALRQTPVQIRFLCEFLERSDIDDTFVDQLRFILVFMKEHEDAADLYEALMKRKKFIFQHLLKARRAAAVMARSNMEIQMMTGVRSPHFDIDQGEQILRLIDRIAVAVFGRTEVLDGALREEELGDQAETLDPSEVIRRLS
jgi:hypothetical protein